MGKQKWSHVGLMSSKWVQRLSFFKSTPTSTLMLLLLLFKNIHGIPNHPQDHSWIIFNFKELFELKDSRRCILWSSMKSFLSAKKDQES